MNYEDNDEEEKEEREESIKTGMKDEAKEHPSFSKKQVKTIVTDHLRMDDDYYKHEEGYGGAGGSPVKFIKREGCLEQRNNNE